MPPPPTARTTAPRSRQASARRPRARPAARGAAAAVPAQVSGVLERLGRALSAGDLPAAAACFAYPSLYLTGADTHEFREPGQVQVVLRRTLEAHADAGIVTTHPEVTQATDLGGGLFACSVEWPSHGVDGRLILTELGHYLVQESAVGTALVRVAVAVGRPKQA